ncbi:peptide-methionine (S)-S-oxide reductase [Granulosicoccus sp.]|jgi:peptide-methionine (S)-S-oxide reductase|nr:peptide-methionine (S)-S-oxide reductase [Granulosicoccus sp.]MDB4222904.1 peptide-methionine (S)-S-oxide reductase [Granulosicoccus sp.]
MKKIEEVYFAGGCLWGVQEFLRYVPGILETEAGRANGTSQSTANVYDGYSECVRTRFDSDVQSLTSLMPYFFEIINPYSLNKQGDDVGEKYRTGVYSENSNHLREARNYINAHPDRTRIKVEILPLSNFVSSDSEHQDRLLRCPDDYCHINEALLYKYK